MSEHNSGGSERIEHQLNSELLPGVRVEELRKEFQARLKRGGVRDYDSRWVEVRRDGLRFILRPDDIPGAIAALEAIQDAIVDEEFRTPDCIYCGQELESVGDAEQHHAANHEGRDQMNDGDGFERVKYEPDPNGSIQRLRTFRSQTAEREVCSPDVGELEGDR